MLQIVKSMTLSLWSQI